MADRSIVVKLRADVAGFRANMASAKKSLDDLSKPDTRKPQKAFDDLSNKAAIMGGVLAIGVGKAVSSFADFDQQMSAVSAALPDAGDKMDALRAAALKLGADTQFSATEAAAGITEMAKAGVSAGDILNGGIKGGLDLAAAGQLDVARASEIAATALNQFNLQGKDVPHVADLYAAAAGKAQGSVDDIANAMKYAGVTASAMGISIEETTGVMGLFASKGIIGEQAGTSFRGMLLSLTSPSKQAAGVMEELGINVYDAQGKFIGMQGAAQVLHERLGGLDEATRNQALGQIFGNESMGAAIALYQGGGNAVKEWTDKVNDAGFASEQASKLTDNLKGDLERLGGSIETAFISSGSSANDTLRSLTQGLGEMVDEVSTLPTPLLLAGTGLAALALTIPKGISVYRDFTKNIDELGLSMEKISTKAPRLGTALRGLQGVAAGLTIATIIGGITKQFTDLEKIKFDPKSIANGTVTLDDFNKKMAQTNDLGLPIATTLSDFDQVLEATFSPGKGQQIDSFFAQLNSNLGFENTSDVEVARKRFEEMDSTLTQLVTSGKGDAAAQLFDQITTAAQKQGITVDQVKDKLPGYEQALVDTGNAAGRLGTEVGNAGGSASGADRSMGDLADGGLAKVEDKAKDAKKEMQDLLDLLDSMAGGRRAISSAKRALNDSGEEAIKAAKDQGGYDAAAVAAQKKAQEAADRAQEDLAKARKRKPSKKGEKVDTTSEERRVADTQAALVDANKRVADSFVSPFKSAENYREKLEATAADGEKLIHTLMEQKKPIGDINKAYGDMRAKLIEAANARGFHGKKAEEEADKVGLTVQEMDDLRFQYANTQAFVDTQVRTPGLPEAKKGMSGYWEVTNGVPHFVETKVSADTTEATGKLNTLNGMKPKPEVKPFLNSAAEGAVEARLDTLARTRAAEIEIRLRDFTTGLGLSGANRKVNDKAFADGGYTGAGGKWQPAGIVHKGEVVFSQEDIRRWGGVHVVESLRTNGGYANGGAVGTAVAASTVGLGGRDLAMLLAALNQPRHNYNISGAGNPEAVARRVMDAQEWKWANGG